MSFIGIKFLAFFKIQKVSGGSGEIPSTKQGF